jgi:PAS domain S-box-containing protein
VVALGASGFLGWALDLPALKSVFQGLATMKANTATGMVLGGTGLALLSRVKAGTPHRFCAAALAMVLAALGALTLGEYFFGWNLGIDELLFRDATQSSVTSRAGRMSPSTAFCFVLAGSALWAASQQIFRRFRLSVVSGLGATLAVIGGVACLGQISDALLHFRLWNYFGMAVHTAAGFFLLGSGLLTLYKSEGGTGWALDKSVTGGFIIAVGIMVTAAGVSWDHTYQLKDASAWVSHTHEVLKEIEDVRADMMELESSQRGYLILGDEQLLAPREQIKTDIRQDIGDLRSLTADNPHQKPRLDELEPLIDQRTAFGEQTILVRRQEGFPAAQQMLATRKGTALSVDIERVLRAMRDEEDSLLATREKQAEAVSTATFLLLPVAVFLSLTTLSLALFFLNAGVTERELAEEASARLAAIVNSSNDAIIGKNLNSIVTSWNSGAEKLFGFSAQEMIGQSITRLIPPDRQQEEMQIIDRVKKGETVDHFDTVRMAKDGHLIDIAVTVSPIKDKTGKIVGASKVARDITERKRAEEVQRATEARYRTLFDYAPNGIVIADTEGYWLDANASMCRMLGYAYDELIGLHASKIVAPEDIHNIEPSLSRVKAKLDHHREGQFRRKDGSIFPTEIHATLMPDGNMVGMISDISERKRAEQEIHDLNVRLEQRVAERTVELEAANKELEAFSYSVSHDLRAPLRAVDGFSQAVLEDYGPQLPEEGRRDLQTIREGAQRMGILIDDLLTFSRLSRSPLKKQEVNTRQLVDNVLEGLNSQREGRQVDIRIGELPACLGDPALLKQVWVNLLSNALKYTRRREAAVIEIGCKREQEGNVYFVRDNGAGFNMRYVNKLFGVFQRLHRADEFEGTGVGLAIVQRIVHRHGGRIWAEAALDQGATFYFTFKESINS